MQDALTDKQLRGLPVYTKSGDSVGKVSGLVVDLGRQEVREYEVRKSNLLAALLPGELRIARGQVIEITAERMTVDDAAVGHKVAAELVPERAAAELPAGAHPVSARGAE